MKLQRTLRFFALLLIVAGLIGLVPLSRAWIKNKTAVAQRQNITMQTVQLQPSPALITGQPVKISIPSLHIDLPIIPGYYNAKSGAWTLTLNKAQFATPSVTPNNMTGNTLIYGHYRPEVFAHLHLIKSGAQAVVTTDNGYVFSYTFESSAPLDPTDTSIFAYKGVPRLTVQTCSGAYMQHRQMYYFHYDSYSVLPNAQKQVASK